MRAAVYFGDNTAAAQQGVPHVELETMPYLSRQSGPTVQVTLHGHTTTAGIGLDPASVRLLAAQLMAAADAAERFV